MSLDEISCPVCGETIKAIAKKCKHCGEWLTSGAGLASHQSGLSSPPDDRLSPGLITTDVVDALASLADKSLAIRETHSGRFQLLETVRQYARDRLLEIDGESDFASRHRDYFVGLAEEAENKRFTDEAPKLMTNLEREHDNLRAALSWCERDSDADAHLRLAAALRLFWFNFGCLREGRERVERALTRPESQSATISRALALSGAGTVVRLIGDTSTARAYYEDGIAILRQHDDPRALALAIYNLATLESELGHADVALPSYDESLDLMRQVGDEGGIALILNGSGGNARFANDSERARIFFDECIALCRKTGNLTVLELALGNRAELAVTDGDYAEARSLYKESLLLQTASRSEVSLVYSVMFMADLEARVGRYVHGIRLLAAADAICRRNGMPMFPYMQAEHDRIEQQLRESVAVETFTDEWDKGFALTTDEALTMALDCCEA